MILTICPNPCIDCTIELEDFRVGRLNRIENKIENLAGKALNTAVGIKRLGGDSFASGFMFERGGRQFVRFLSGEGIENDFVWSKGRLRTNYKIIDSKNMMTEINDKGEPVSKRLQEELLSKISELSEAAKVVVVSGSLPVGVEDEYYYKMIKAAGAGAKVIVDAEKGRLKAALNAGVYMVKPNLYELESFFEEDYSSYEEMIDGCKKLIDMGAERVMLSLGKSGSIYTDGKNSYFCKSANVAVNSTVGAGDSMVAAAAIAIEKEQDMETTLLSCVAAATASITTPGTNLFTKEKYDEILEKLSVVKM